MGAGGVMSPGAKGPITGATWAGATPVASLATNPITDTPPGTIGAPPLATGSITPPAPLAPLNPG